MECTLEQLATLVDGELIGEPGALVSQVATIKNAAAGQICFLSSKPLRKYLPETKATAVILTQDDLANCKTNAIVVETPVLAYIKVAKKLHNKQVSKPFIHPTAVIDPEATLHKSVSVGAYSVIGAGVQIAKGSKIGCHCLLDDNVTLQEDVCLHNNVTVLAASQIGARTALFTGVVIGSDGFGHANDNGHWVKIPQLGSVKIGCDVEIGANSTVDCGAIEDTVIGNGVRLDNLVQIGHNVQIGNHTAIAAMTAVAGSTIIGQYCMIGGKVAISGHINIADHVSLTGRTTVLQSIKKPGVYSSCAPLVENSKWHKNYMQMKKMDELAKRVKQLEKLVDSANEDK